MFHQVLVASPIQLLMKAQAVLKHCTFDRVIQMAKFLNNNKFVIN